MPTWYYEDNDHHAQFVFGPSVEAVADALVERTGIPFKLRACPSLDHCEAAGRVTDADLLEAGWSVECAQCGHDLSCDGCERCDDDAEGKPAEGEPVRDCVQTSGDLHFCGAECLRAWEEAIERRKAAYAAAEAKLLARYPFVTVTDRFVGGFGWCRDCYRANPNNACLHFTFAGAHRESSGDYCGGCDRVGVQRGSGAAFRALKAANQPPTEAPTAEPAAT